MNRKVYLIGALVLVICSAVARGQDVTKPTKGDDKIISATNLVTVNVIVTDNSGNYVKGLKREQFSVIDDPRAQLRDQSRSPHRHLVRCDLSMVQADRALSALVSGHLLGRPIERAQHSVHRSGRRLCVHARGRAAAG